MKISWVLGGLAGGLVGAAIWTGVSYATEYEVGWIAWIIGALTGLGVRRAAQEDVGYGPGAVAVVIAVLAVFAGKYGAVHFAMRDAFSSALTERGEPTDDDLMIVVADEVVGEFEGQGKALQWPEGMSVAIAQEEADYPAEVWAEASRRLAAKSPGERQAMKDDLVRMHDAFLGEFQGQIRNQAFLASFSPFDLLWIVLAVASAFRIGSGATPA